MALKEDIERLHADVPLARASVLVIDDELLFGRAIARHLERGGYVAVHVATLAAAEARMAAGPVDLILLDVRLPDGSGLDFLARVRARDDVPVIVMTAYGLVDDAVAAMKQGASDYLKKPLDLEELALNVEKVLAQRALARQLEYSKAREARAGDRVELRGESPPMVALRDQVARIAALAGTAPQPPAVLITGATGSGKDVTARLLHQSSARAARPFVHVDCAALPKDLIEAELFGHVRGAFTHAVAERTGLIEAAEDGVVFLDEIGELPLDLQAKLLAVLERRSLRRIGSSQEQRTGAWFIAATNRAVDAMVAAGALRADLYFRLKVLTLELPPLAARGDDVTALAEHFASDLARRYGTAVPRLTDDALALLRAYAWPGNVRELHHVIERAVLLAQDGVIDSSALALEVAPPGGGSAGHADLEEMTLDEVERHLLAHALKRASGNVSEAARRLGITRMAMRYRMQKYGLSGADG